MSSLADVGRLQTLGASRYFELHAVTLDEALEALRLDRAVVHEDVLATFLRDEAEALRIVEPLHGTGCHFCCPPGASLRHLLIRPSWSGVASFCFSSAARGGRDAARSRAAGPVPRARRSSSPARSPRRARCGRCGGCNPPAYAGGRS